MFEGSVFSFNPLQKAVASVWFNCDLGTIIKELSTRKPHHCQRHSPEKLRSNCNPTFWLFSG